jgi:type II secretory ATPase GspE/PulE/Tfp pilus assembly ATPase PilB-like protein
LAATRDRGLDVRVSTLPTQFGEKAVLRLLGSASIPTLGALGLSPDERALLDDAVSQPQGPIPVTGPTGAGKSTTLYAMLTSRLTTDVNIVTIEDPIEYQVPGASQVQVDAKAGLTFAGCLRAILRQDPDHHGRRDADLETAEIGFQAALTGHLVFSTLHTNGSLAAIERFSTSGSNRCSSRPPPTSSSRSGSHDESARPAARPIGPPPPSCANSTCGRTATSSSTERAAGIAGTPGTRDAWASSRFSG